ncbi:MAG: amino acid ABC transporter ATP-binding protein [Smithellaceae bacterium]|nr:amino acid ABC transporter ATP-binding protein [Smithellaceae bacterium]
MISVRHLSKTFGRLVVLKEVNVEIDKGEVISVIGPSGCGKSTFLRCLNLLERPTGGEIIIDGIHLLDKKTNVFQLRQKMGMVFQSFNLFSHLMVIENIMLGPVHLLRMNRPEAFEEGMKLLAMVGLAEKAYAYPDELSGGQKQRLAIARALAMKPEIVLFDEPTSALDPTMVSEVLAVIRRLAADGMTMMIVTHEMRFARDVSTRVLYMDEGIIYEEGTPRQIYDRPAREKTRNFVHKIRTYSYEIRSRTFDLYALNAGIETFCRKQFIAENQIFHIQLILEELIVNQLLVRQEDPVALDVMVGYSEESGAVEISLHYAGGPYNPFDEAEEEDDLSMVLLRKLAQKREYAFQDSVNRLKMIL